MTSGGEMSAAMMTTPIGSVPKLDEGAVLGFFRSDFCTSLTPRLSVLFLDAKERYVLERCNGQTGQSMTRLDLPFFTACSNILVWAASARG
jgi:hypothetical protein